MYKSDFEKKCDAVEMKLRGRKSSLVSRVLGFVLIIPPTSIMLAYESWVVMLVWNWLVAEAVGLALTFWAAFGINLVISFLVAQPRRRSLYELLWAGNMQIKITTMALILGSLAYLLS